MKKGFMLLGLTLLTILGYAQVNYIYKNGTSYPEKEFRKVFGCKDDETIKQCQTRMRNDTLRRADSIKREEERREYDLAKSSRESWALEKERRSKLTPEERQKEDEIVERLRQESQQEKKVSKTGRLGTMFWLGLNSSNIRGNTPDYTPATGVKFGVHTHIFNFSDYVGLGLGAEYSMQGAKYKSTDYIPGGSYGTSSSSTTSRLNYLNFPVLVHYQKQRHGFFAEAGVQPGVLLSAKSKGTNTTDLKANLKKFDVGIPVGAGYHFKNKFGAGLRFTPGLLNINKDDKFKSHNMVTSLSASYSL